MSRILIKDPLESHTQDFLWTVRHIRHALKESSRPTQGPVLIFPLIKCIGQNFPSVFANSSQDWLPVVKRWRTPLNSLRDKHHHATNGRLFQFSIISICRCEQLFSTTSDLQLGWQRWIFVEKISNTIHTGCSQIFYPGGLYMGILFLIYKIVVIGDK